MIVKILTFELDPKSESFLVTFLGLYEQRTKVKKCVAYSWRHLACVAGVDLVVTWVEG